MIETLSEEIERLKAAIEECTGSLPETQLLMSISGVSYYSALMIYAEVGEVTRFDQDKEVVSYAGLNPVIRESGDSRLEGVSRSEDHGSYGGSLFSMRGQLSIRVKTSTCVGSILRDRDIDRLPVD
jgi:hypothetical protein